MVNLFKERHIRECLLLLDIDEPTPIAKISEKINVNSRTFKSDLKEITKFLNDRGIELLSKRGMGICTEGTSNQKQKTKQELLALLDEVSLGRESRCKEILLDCLLEREIPTLEDWSYKFNVSRPTLLKDLEVVRNWLAEKGLTLNGKPGRGYALEGRDKELCIRDAVVALLLDNDQYSTSGKEKYLQNAEILKVLEKNNFNVIEEFVDNVQRSMNTDVAERDRQILCLRVAVTIVRIESGNITEMEPDIFLEVSQSRPYSIVADNIGTIEQKFELILPPSEMAYIALLFMTAKPQTLIHKPHSLGYQEYLKLAKDVARISQDVLGIPLAYDTELIGMLATHLETTITKLKYGIAIDNPLTEEVKKEYPLYFSVAKVISTLLTNKLGAKITEEEMAYIAMYIAAAAEKTKTNAFDQKKIAVFCPLGIGMSNFIHWKLSNEFPDVEVVQIGSYRELTEGSIGPDIKLLVSTMPIENSNVPHVVVSHLLNEEEITEIRNILDSRNIQRYLISEFMDEDLILLNLEAHDNYSAISKLAEKLVQGGYAKDGYVKAIMEREKEFPTGINNIVPFALPHVDYSFSLKEGLAIAVLANDVAFGQMGSSEEKISVRIILMPVLLPGGSLGKVLTHLLESMKNIKFLRKLMSAKSPSEVKELFIEELS